MLVPELLASLVNRVLREVRLVQVDLLRLEEVRLGQQEEGLRDLVEGVHRRLVALQDHQRVRQEEESVADQ
jgi:endonuclease/exonuclease/phosphatase family metal-dependent hydrolase